MRTIFILILSFFFWVSSPTRAQAFHLGVGFGSAFEPAALSIHTKTLKFAVSTFGNDFDVGVMRVFDLWGPFYAGVGGHAAIGFNAPTLGPAAASGIRIDLWVLRLGIEGYFLVSHKGTMEGQGLLEVGVGW